MINTFEVDLYSLCLRLLFALEEPIKKDQCELIRLIVLVTGVLAELAQTAPEPAIVVLIKFF